MAGFREFVTGEVLTAANVDDFLAKQAVMKFADAAARDSALGTAVGGGNALREGMVAWLDSVDELQAYDGAAWGSVSSTSASNLTSGTLASARLPAGTVVDVKSVLKTDVFSVSLAGGASALITDLEITHAVQNAANKVLVYVNCGMTAGLSWMSQGIALAFDGTLVQVATGAGNRQTFGSGFWTDGEDLQSGGVSMGFHYLVTPGDTSSHTYAAHIQNGQSVTRTYYVNRAVQDTDTGDRARASSSIIIMEVTG